jgi:hypothetical protein
VIRGAVAGAAAAAAWAAAEPGVARLVSPPAGYSDVRLLGALLTGGGRGWRAVGLGTHLVNGALFGAAFASAGAHGWRQGLVAAQVENVALWPVMALLDRVHPDRRSDAWPALAGNRRVFAYEAAVHALFGVVLGALIENAIQNEH